MRPRKSYRRPEPAFGRPFSVGSRTARWCESPGPSGLREVRRSRIGWYVHVYGAGETTHGLVFRLPRSAGELRFVAGCSDPYNDAPAIVATDDRYDSEHEAARAAEQLAEWYAKDAREFDESACAYAEWDDLGREFAAIERDATLGARRSLGLIRRASKAGLSEVAAELRSAARSAIAEAKRRLAAIAEKRERLEDTYSGSDGWEVSKP